MAETKETKRHIGRRTALKLGGIAAASTLAAPLATMSAKANTGGRTYVLVHGAWHGGWVWKFVTPHLRAKGHTVYAPTLTGLGDRAHLLTTETDLRTHVNDVVGLMEMEDLNDVVLVGWSYGGMVVTGALAQVRERVSSMVYLDAFWPENGQSVLDMQPPNRRAFYLKHAADKKPIPPIPLKAFGVSDPEMVAFAQPRLRPQPPLTLTQPVSALEVRPKNIPHTYIRATGFDPSPFKVIVAKKVKPDPTIKYAEIGTGHDAMLIAPKKLAEMLHAVD